VTPVFPPIPTLSHSFVGLLFGGELSSYKLSAADRGWLAGRCERSLTEVACSNDPAGSASAAAAVFDAVAGTTYRIKVDGAGTQAGDLTLNWGDAPVVVPGAVLAIEGDVGIATAYLPVTLSAPSPVPVSVDWTIGDVPDNPGVAHPGEDSLAGSGTIVFAPGETAKTVAIEVIGDTDFEPGLLWGAEWGLVVFSNAESARFEPGLFGRIGIFLIPNDD
jgi:hypothetical protein